MPHDNHCLDGVNKDLQGGRDLAYYLRLTEGWTDPMGPPAVTQTTLSDGRIINIVRDDLHGCGTKGRIGDLLVSRTVQNTIVYVQPRCGFAGISLARLAAKYKKRLVLFCPASKEVSIHQRKCYEMGADLRFVRIAAMPNLGKIAGEWAAKNNALFVPLGLRHELVTAAAVRVAHDMAVRWGFQPTRVWHAISTGVLSRGLQIGWPNSTFISVAVARNLKHGELGRSAIYSHPRPFTEDAKTMPPFDSASNYDAKVWEYILANGQTGDLMWNVAGNIKCCTNNDLNSHREWGDMSDTFKL